MKRRERPETTVLRVRGFTTALVESENGRTFRMRSSATSRDLRHFWPRSKCAAWAALASDEDDEDDEEEDEDEDEKDEEDEGGEDEAIIAIMPFLSLLAMALLLPLLAAPDPLAATEKWCPGSGSFRSNERSVPKMRLTQKARDC